MHRALPACTLLFTASLFGTPAPAQSLDVPAVRAGDTWTYRAVLEKGPVGANESHQEIKVTRVTPSTIFYALKSSATGIPREIFSLTDWSRLRNINGKETPVSKPLSFPLQPGKSWEIAYDEDKLGGAYLTEHTELKFTAVGYETIEVGAGKFNALKIEAEGRWLAHVAAATRTIRNAQTDVQGSTRSDAQVIRTPERDTSGRLYKAFWYVPDVKRWVKSVEENYNSGGARNERYSTELEAFKSGE